MSDLKAICNIRFHVCHRQSFGFGSRLIHIRYIKTAKIVDITTVISTTDTKLLFILRYVGISKIRMIGLVVIRLK